MKEVLQDKDLLEAIPFSRTRWSGPEAAPWVDISFPTRPRHPGSVDRLSRSTLALAGFALAHSATSLANLSTSYSLTP